MFKTAVFRLAVGSAVVVASCSSKEAEEPAADPSPVVVYSDTSAPEATTGESEVPVGEPVEASGDLRSATVRVATTGTYVAPGVGEVESLAGSGSAFVIDPSGLAVTNNHVVAGAAVIEVFFDGSSTGVPASVVGTSECADLAVLQLDGDGFPSLGWASEPARTGTLVRAGGFPDGVVEFTLSEGIVSRESSEGATPWAAIPSLLQHDATLRPGNSGGPLVDSSGRVVGVNTATSTAAQFSVPTAVAQPIVDRLAAGEDVDSVGLNVIAVRDEVTNEAGVWVVSVRTGSIADRAGIEPGDFIVRMQGIRVGLDGTLSDYCGVIRTAGGAPVQVEIVRGDETLAGVLGGDEPLSPVLGFTDTVEPQAVSQDPVSTPVEGDPFSGFERVIDDTGVLAVDVPVEWSDRQTAPVFFADADRPGVAASTDVAAMDAAAGTTYDVGGVATLLFDTTTSMEDTFGVIVDNSPWNYDCEASEPIDFDDGVYRGLAGVFVGCNGGTGAVITLTVERIGSGKWMLMNVFVASLADLDAAKRALQTFDFLEPTTDDGTVGSGSTSTTVPAPTEPSDDEDDTTSQGSEESDDGRLPEATSLLDLIGSPDPDATVQERLHDEVAFNLYEHHVGGDTLFEWLDDIPTRIDCQDPYSERPQPLGQSRNTTAELWCTVDHAGIEWTLSVVVLVSDAWETTNVSVSPAAES